MFVDFARDVELPKKADVCIIGAGIAGLTAAHALRQAGLSVILVEGGGLRDEERSQSLYDTGVEFVSQKNTGVSNGRFRVFGGSGTRWGGQVIPLAPHEIASHRSTGNVGWPIDGAVLEPYYEKLDKLLDLQGTPFDSRCYQYVKKMVLEEDEVIDVRFSKWLPWRKRNLGRYFKSQLERDLQATILYHANAVEILHDGASTTINGVRIRSYGEREAIISARYFILASGTIESVRLLLVSRSHFTNGIGNQHDLLGRFFMDHVVLRAGFIRTTDRQALFQMIRPFFVKDVLHTPRFELTPAIQESEGCLSGYAQVTFEAAPDSAFAKIRTVFHDYQTEGLRALSKSPYWSLLHEMPDLLAGLFARTVLGLRPIPARSTPVIRLFAEQPPRAESRLYIGQNRDALGMSTVKMNWWIGEDERRTLTVTGRRFEALLKRRLTGSVNWFTECFDTEIGAKLSQITDLYHHLGGARMASSEREGAIDPNCRVYGTSNLYLASGAAFPTSGCSNPTFTIMALALRVVDHLREQR